MFYSELTPHGHHFLSDMLLKWVLCTCAHIFVRVSQIPTALCWEHLDVLFCATKRQQIGKELFLESSLFLLHKACVHAEKTELR